ncbi:MAG: hypothetical protein CL844_10015 [Crocinitomicaceae bacterium]|nr:hypothetical protein [Crocinitomicaceae bacterium]|tara:strand:+ start:19565 stop:20659 length:1095 start_codon:yes stop_codon:yes gene_type:complete
MREFVFFLFLFLLFCCNDNREESPVNSDLDTLSPVSLSLEDAKRLVQLPLDCVDREFPNKLNQVISSKEELLSPRQLHPTFYGCFDWHSSVHAHWSLVRILKIYPNIDEKNKIIETLKVHLSKENISREVEYFKLETSQGFERMYGWAWLLRLSQELNDSDIAEVRNLEENLKPLTKLIVNRIFEFLPKLKYPIRVGTHTNTAFSLTMIYDFAQSTSNIELVSLVKEKAINYYMQDSNCPISWEPSGYDFLSPCLEEANLMRRVLHKEEFKSWLAKFLPSLVDKKAFLAPGVVSDRKDGHLVHLDGLNFSRAWCLYGIAESVPEYSYLIKLANSHVVKSLVSLYDGNYEGGHWLGSFALMSLTN